MIICRILSLLYSLISVANISVTRLTGSSIFDCPEQSHTSPINISFSLMSLIRIRYGPPAFIDGSVTLQCPLLSAVAAYFFFMNVTLTLSPASAVPHILTGCSRCNTIPSEIKAGSFTFASVCKAVQKQSNTATPNLILS